MFPQATPRQDASHGPGLAEPKCRLHQQITVFWLVLGSMRVPLTLACVPESLLTLVSPSEVAAWEPKHAQESTRNKRFC